MYKISRIYVQFLSGQNILTKFSKLGVRQNFISDKYLQVSELVELMTNFQSHKIFLQTSLGLESGNIVFQTSTYRFRILVELMTNFLLGKVFLQTSLTFESGKKNFIQAPPGLKN